MPKGGRKRTAEDYDREIIEAAQRMRKYPEHLQAARDSDDWIDFLDNIGVKTSKAKFWQDVRQEVSVQVYKFTPRELAEANVEVFVSYRNARGQFTKEPTGEPIPSYWSKETKQFVKKSSIGR